MRLALSLCVLSSTLFAADIVPAGSGSYLQGLPGGAKGPDVAPRRVDASKSAVPTNDWCSALYWSDKSFAQFPHPLAVKAEAAGLRIALPKVRGTKNDIFGMLPGQGEDLVLSHSADVTFETPKVEKASDWFITALFASGDRKLHVSYGHGSPFVYATYEGGSPRVRFTKPPRIWSGDANSATLGITVNGTAYGLFAPAGTKWKGLEGTQWDCETAKAYFSLAALPDDRPETLAQFAKVAHNHIVDTQVQWKYEPASADVTTAFQFTTKAYEGNGQGTLFALYPHQWRHATSPLTPLQYASVRGAMKVGAGNSFTTRMKFPGILPALPNSGQLDAGKLTASIKEDTQKGLGDFRDTYWEGKQLGRLANLVAIADAANLPTEGQDLAGQLEKRLESWFTADAAKAKGVFAYEPKWGTLIGYPASFGSDDQLNDHHFHYGYYFRAAAEVARRNPAWAADAKWGAMVKLLIRDVVSPDRKDALFPFMRTFDPYAGHTWASGHARFEDGNNNESSSEALNAWAGITLFGEAIGDKSLRDFGAWLFTTELNAIEENWFNVHRDNFPPEYLHPVVTMVWGGKGVHGTWFSGNPESIYGINWLPITASSLYLGRYPDHVDTSYKALLTENLADDAKKAAKAGKPAPTGDGSSWDAWPDLMRMYRALSDPDDALKQQAAAEASGKMDIEAGNSRTNVAYWLHSLKALGRVQKDVTADTTCYAVFQDGPKRSYTAWNLGAKDITVRFSDGMQMPVPAGKSATQTKNVPAK